jgi:hypothetical protein
MLSPFIPCLLTGGPFPHLCRSTRPAEERQAEGSGNRSRSQCRACRNHLDRPSPGGGQRAKVNARSVRLRLAVRPHLEGCLTAQGHPRAIFKRAVERRNLVIAEATAREVGWLTLDEALSLLILYADQDPTKYDRRGPMARPLRHRGQGRVVAQGAACSSGAITAPRRRPDSRIEAAHGVGLAEWLRRPVPSAKRGRRRLTLFSGEGGWV